MSEPSRYTAQQDLIATAVEAAWRAERARVEQWLRARATNCRRDDGPLSPIVAMVLDACASDIAGGVHMEGEA